MENNTVLWITIAAYIICLVVIGIVAVSYTHLRAHET